MARQIFVNLPVADLERTVKFFGALGFEFEPRYSNDDAVCMIVDRNIFVMLLVERFFRTFTHKTPCDTRHSTEVLVCLSCDSREHVRALVQMATEAGGSVPREAQDHGFMYAHGFEDPDGHTWELVYMEPGEPASA